MRRAGYVGHNVAAERADDRATRDRDAGDSASIRAAMVRAAVELHVPVDANGYLPWSRRCDDVACSICQRAQDIDEALGVPAAEPLYLSRRPMTPEQHALLADVREEEP